MKIRELFEAPTPITNVPFNRQTADTKIKKMMKGKKLGQGAFGAAYEVPKDVTTVVKSSRLNYGKWYADGYYNYIEKIKDITDNPYLPIIHEIRRMKPTSPGQEPYLLVNVEQLVPGQKLSLEELSAVITRITGKQFDFSDPAVIKKFSWGSGKLSPHHLLSRITNAVDGYASGYHSVLQITDPQLIQALNIVKKLKKEGYTVDLHDENFMFRRTPYGPQLVLTDPLAFYRGNKTTDSVPVKVVAKPKH